MEGSAIDGIGEPGMGPFVDPHHYSTLSLRRHRDHANSAVRLDDSRALSQELLCFRRIKQLEGEAHEKSIEHAVWKWKQQCIPAEQRDSVADARGDRSRVCYFMHAIGNIHAIDLAGITNRLRQLEDAVTSSMPNLQYGFTFPGIELQQPRVPQTFFASRRDGIIPCADPVVFLDCLIPGSIFPVKLGDVLWHLPSLHHLG